MSILTIGGDLRYAHLALLAPSRALECAAAGMERCPLKPPHACIEDAARADAIILPNPWRGGIQLPFAEQAFTPEDIFSRIRPGTPVLLSDAVSMPDALTRRFPAVKWVDLSRDEAFIQQNARLTAEVGSSPVRSASTSSSAVMALALRPLALTISLSSSA